MPRVVCSAEKPIATSVVETVEAINACNEAGVQLMTALQRRFDPNFLRVKQAIKSGEIGEVVTVKLCSRDPAPPPVEYVKGGGGIFKDMAVHDLDMARYLMDSEPVAIMALGSCQIDPAIKTLEGPEAYDTATIVMKFANGKDAIIDVCRQAPYGYDQRAEVLGKKAMIQTDNTYPNVRAPSPHASDTLRQLSSVKPRHRTVPSPLCGRICGRRLPASSRRHSRATQTCRMTSS